VLWWGSGRPTLIQKISTLDSDQKSSERSEFSWFQIWATMTFRRRWRHHCDGRTVTSPGRRGPREDLRAALRRLVQTRTSSSLLVWAPWWHCLRKCFSFVTFSVSEWSGSGNLLVTVTWFVLKNPTSIQSRNLYKCKLWTD
jgi:hypothetical protein